MSEHARERADHPEAEQDGRPGQQRAGQTLAEAVVDDLAEDRGRGSLRHGVDDAERDAGGDETALFADAPPEVARLRRTTGPACVVGGRDRALGRRYAAPLTSSQSIRVIWPTAVESIRSGRIRTSADSASRRQPTTAREVVSVGDGFGYSGCCGDGYGRNSGDGRDGCGLNR
ncbi:hypothetical protein [Salana multivorans]